MYDYTYILYSVPASSSTPAKVCQIWVMVADCCVVWHSVFHLLLENIFQLTLDIFHFVEHSVAMSMEEFHNLQRKH